MDKNTCKCDCHFCLELKHKECFYRYDTNDDYVCEKGNK